MVGQAVKYQLPDGAVIDAIVTFEYPGPDVQPVPGAEEAVDADELARVRAGRRQVNLLHVSPNPADTSAHGRVALMASSVPHRDHHGAEGDSRGFWYEGGE